MLRMILTSLLLCCLLIDGQAQLDSLLQVLDEELDHREEYLAQKNKTLAAFDAARAEAKTAEERFGITLRKVAALESFSFTRASEEVNRLKALAQEIGKPESIARAKIREAFILLSSGLFNEALDSLNTIDLQGFPADLKLDFYATRSRGHVDLAQNYAIPSLEDKYRALSVTDIDSALVYAEKGSLKYLELLSNQAMAIPDPAAGIRLYHKIRQHPDAYTRLMAKEHGAAGVQFTRLNLTDSARLAFVQSAIADERTVTREIIALVRVARNVYEMGDFERSARYIKVGLENANFFNARHRKIEVLEILPLIEEERRQLLRLQRQQFIIFTSLLALFLLLAIWLIRRTIQQNRELKQRRQALFDAYQQLRQNNAALHESQKIKEQYVGYFFQTNTKFINAAKKVIDKTTKAIYAADFKEAKFQLRSFDAKQQNKQLLKDFDRAFLTLFPDFVEHFQKLFPAEVIWQEEGQEDLSTEVRIFALMRLGIRNNDIIARILGYSVNTIYAYRSKVKGKSPLDNEAFDMAVMDISSGSLPPIPETNTPSPIVG